MRFWLHRLKKGDLRAAAQKGVRAAPRVVQVEFEPRPLGLNRVRQLACDLPRQSSGEEGGF